MASWCAGSGAEDAAAGGVACVPFAVDGADAGGVRRGGGWGELPGAAAAGRLDGDRGAGSGDGHGGLLGAAGPADCAVRRRGGLVAVGRGGHGRGGRAGCGVDRARRTGVRADLSPGPGRGGGVHPGGGSTVDPRCHCRLGPGARRPAGRSARRPADVRVPARALLARPRRRGPATRPGWGSGPPTTRCSARPSAWPATAGCCSPDGCQRPGWPTTPSAGRCCSPAPASSS